LDELLQRVPADARVCAVPERWGQMLPVRRREGAALNLPPPLVLAGSWDAPALRRTLRLEEHIRHAAAHGVLSDVDRYPRGLSEDDWAHLRDF